MPLLRILFTPVLLLALVTLIVLPMFIPVMAASVVENLFYDLATDSLSDWTEVAGGASRTGIRIESSFDTLSYIRNDLAINQNAFLFEAVVSGSALAGPLDGELGARMWVKLSGYSPPSQCIFIEVRFVRQGTIYKIALFNGHTGTLLASLDKDWTETSPRLRVRIKLQEVGPSDYIFLQAEESSSWDNPDQPNNINDSSQAVLLTSFTSGPGFSEFGFGNFVPLGNYYSDWESIHLTICDDDTTVLPYWPAEPPIPTLTHDDKGMDNPQGIDFLCDLTSSGYLTNDSVTSLLDADGTTYYGETRLNPGNEVWDFDGLNDDQTVYGRIVVTDVSGRSTISPDGITIIPNRTTVPALSNKVGGEVHPINKAAVLAPWLGLGAVLILTAGGLILVRRRDHK